MGTVTYPSGGANRRHAAWRWGSAFALAIKGSVLRDRGQFVHAHACFDEMLSLLEGTRHQVVSSVLNWIRVASCGMGAGPTLWRWRIPR